MTVSGCNNFIYFLSLTIPKMDTLFLYIQSFVFDKKNIEKTKRIFLFSYPLFIFVCLFIFIIWY